MNLVEIGNGLREARLSAGLSQADIASMAGVSRATLNALENGRGDISSLTLLKVADLLSVSISLTPQKPTVRSWATSAIEMAAASASVSYASVLPSKQLATALLTGTIDNQWMPHIAHFVDEQSNQMIIRVVRDVAASANIEPKKVWRNARKLADGVESANPRWKKSA
ncbi:MAG: helix-turn-helix transcriptional regulator [Candidatus Nanopelagicales bacterium]|nr:helix-turn-helix transcriptional regulator [Candidatus Nanopelagicales bacterium]